MHQLVGGMSVDWRLERREIERKGTAEKGGKKQRQHEGKLDNSA